MILYGTLATSAGALLGLILASIAILLTLDSGRPDVKDMQKLDAWRILNVTLLTAGAFMALDLLLSMIALGVDSAKRGKSGVETAVLAVSLIGFCELVVGGMAFSLVVMNLVRSKD